MESSPMPRLAWKWIVEKLVDLRSFNVQFVNEMITKHVPDFEEPHCRSLLERVALRNLEEMVITNQIDSGAILLLKELTKQDLGGPGTSIGSSIKQRSLKELVLRVQTEVVLSVLRKDVDEGETDWASFEAALEKVFGDAEEDYRLLERKRELSVLLKSKSQTKVTVAAYFDKYSFNKLRNDLHQFIKEKIESFSTIFLDQLSRDFLDANGRLFPDDVKSTALEAFRKPDDVGHNTQTGDQHILVGTAVMSGKKRLRRKPLPKHDGTRESEKAEEGSPGMKKPRINLLMPVVKPWLRQGVPELAVPASRPQRGVKQEIESCKQLSSSNRSEERLFDLRDVDPEVMRSCSPAAHESISMEGTTFFRREPSRKNEYVVISDADSDAETQVVKTLSDDNEGSVRMKSDGDKHIKEGAQSLSENGSYRDHSRIIVETEVVRKEASNKQKILADGKEAFTSSPKAEVSQEDTQKFVDSQDTYEVDFKEVGSDGYEDECHICGDGGTLVCCDGCPIAMHVKCIKRLGIRLYRGKLICPVCMSLKAAQRAAEAENAAVAAKVKLKAFKMESKTNRRFCSGSATPRFRQEKAVKRSRRKSCLQSAENDRSLKPKQLSDDEPKLSDIEGQQDSEPSKAYLVPTILRIGYHELEQRDSEHLLPEDKSQAHRVASSDQGKDVRNAGRALRVKEQLAKASLSSLVKNDSVSIRDGSAKSASPKTIPHIPQASEEGLRRMSERTAPISEMRIHEVDNDEENAEQVRAGVPDPGSRAGCRGEVEDDEDDKDGDEDRSEVRNRGRAALFSGRYKLPGVRRIRLPWTRQEEHVLKEGVKRYSNNGTWGFQWKRIREYGQGTFDPSRTEVDLKDKWRNLVRAVS